MTNYSNVLVGNLSELTNGKVTMDNFKGLSICISQSGTIFCLPLISSDGEIRLYTTTGDPVTISFDIYMDIAYM